MTNHDFLAGGRRLRAILRERRIACGLSEEAVANRLKWPPSRLPQIETGQVPITDEELSAVLSLYGIDEPDQVRALRESAKRTRQAAWWTEYRGRIPDHYLELIAAEADASRIVHFQPTFIPGLLQTRAYTTAITPATTLDYSPEEYTHDRVEVRMRRQREVFKGRRQTELTALIDESSLRRTIGSSVIMREQLDQLKFAISEALATIIVVPTSAGPHPGLLGSFIIIDYDDYALDDLLCAGGATGNVLIRNAPDLVAKYRKLAGQLVASGLRDDQAAAMIDDIRKVYE